MIFHSHKLHKTGDTKQCHVGQVWTRIFSGSIENSPAASLYLEFGVKDTEQKLAAKMFPI